MSCTPRFLSSVTTCNQNLVPSVWTIQMPSSSFSPARLIPSAKFVSADKRRITGDPEIKYVSTSYVERQNLTMRMHMRRFTRLTNSFSKKLENHMHAISLYFMFYNFCKIHKTLRVTPAMEAGIADHVWNIINIVALIPEDEPKKRGPYKMNK